MEKDGGSNGTVSAIFGFVKFFAFCVKFWAFFAHILCADLSGWKLCQRYFVSFFISKGQLWPDGASRLESLAASTMHGFKLNFKISYKLHEVKWFIHMEREKTGWYSPSPGRAAKRKIHRHSPANNWLLTLPTYMDWSQKVRIWNKEWWRCWH